MEEKRGKIRTRSSSSEDIDYGNNKKDSLSVAEIASLLLSVIYDGVPVAA
jgi:hypothetical protein